LTLTRQVTPIVTRGLFGKGIKIFSSPLHLSQKQSTSKYSNFISHQ